VSVSVSMSVSVSVSVSGAMTVTMPVLDCIRMELCGSRKMESCSISQKNAKVSSRVIFCFCELSSEPIFENF